MSSSIVPFSSSLQSFPASGSFQMNQFFTSGGQIIGFSFSNSPSSEYSGLLSFRMDWFDLLAVQGTLKTLLQHHSSKTSILWCSAFFTIQLSHPHMTTGTNIVLTRWTFVGKVMSLLILLGTVTNDYHICAILPNRCKLPLWKGHKRPIATWNIARRLYVCDSHSVVSNSLWPHWWYSIRLFSPWDSPGKNTGVGFHFLFQWIFPILGYL